MFCGHHTAPPQTKWCFTSQTPIKRWTRQRSQPGAAQEAPSQFLLHLSSPGWAHANTQRPRVQTGLGTEVYFKGGSPKPATGGSAEDPVEWQHHPESRPQPWACLRWPLHPQALPQRSPSASLDSSWTGFPCLQHLILSPVWLKQCLPLSKEGGGL